ncbi:MAG: biotin/lipoyl-binding protein [Candidatus Aminicenantes bacterium]|nr:biotin/lipoyl-binding protein [Candidatus Aminicenantes bacterium]
MNISLLCNNKEFKLNVKEAQDGYLQISVNKKSYLVSAEFVSGEEILLKINGKVYDVIVSKNSNSYDICMTGKSIRVDKKSPFQLIKNRADTTKKAEVKTSMPGRVVELLVQEGRAVKHGEPVLVLEAMKMQNEIKSPRSGQVKKICPKEGESVEAGAVLFTIE